MTVTMSRAAEDGGAGQPGLQAEDVGDGGLQDLQLPLPQPGLHIILTSASLDWKYADSFKFALSCTVLDLCLLQAR